MVKCDERVDTYISTSQEFAKPILIHLRALIHEACPDVVETWKWSFPNFLYKGEILCNMAAFKKHCSFGFWKAGIMQDSEGILTIKQKSSMGHLGKIESLTDLPEPEILMGYIKIAMALTDNDVKKPPKQKATEQEKKDLFIPDYFREELDKYSKAKSTFDNFSYSHRKEYVQWITEAKTEATRNKRMAQTIAWLEDGKGRNWKYENC